ncbi:hypothetical protein Ahy_A04g017557 isoform B [Arachis hypogaea]|uniref:Uncharacterized protein n=1 Tax=Arachis hypogaea TaxID=3818 RepID=A0A445DBF9_ARAHY|nr:hypothetical protein Ahy_A04g017557 isoform B [Arachis hypogaea]
MPFSRSNHNSPSYLVKISSVEADCYFATHNLPFWINLNNGHAFQLLQNVSSNSTTALAEMWGAASIPLATTINPLESTNTKTTSQIDLSCHRSCNENLTIPV